MVPLLAKRAHQRSWAPASTGLPGDLAAERPGDAGDGQALARGWVQEAVAPIEQAADPGETDETERIPAIGIAGQAHEGKEKDAQDGAAEQEQCPAAREHASGALAHLVFHALPPWRWGKRCAHRRRREPRDFPGLALLPHRR